jgi:hypothetical protein
MKEVQFITDTATLCVFDLGALKHRLNDDCDWWSVPDEELAEVNQGNVAFVGLAEDGKFSVAWDNELEARDADVSFLLNCPTGRLFIGAAEEVTGGGLEPEAVRGGALIEIAVGTYKLLIRRVGSRELAHRLIPIAGPARNSFAAPVRI